MHHLMGLSEIAELLGVSRQRAQQLTQRADFPPFMVRLATGPVWESREIAAWAQRDRPTGRPRSTANEQDFAPVTHIQSPPPHLLTVGSVVPGHDVELQPAGQDLAQGLCTCGWRGSVLSNREAAADASEHRRYAWPIVMPREHDESATDWAARVQHEYLAAIDARQEIWTRNGMGRPIEAGQPYPVLSPEYTSADDQVDVLEHNLATAHEAMRAENGAR